MFRIKLFTIVLLWGSFACAQSIDLTKQQDRWTILRDGSIEWKIDHRLPHSDHIEMGGEKVALWVQYKADTAGKLSISRTSVFPTFRLEPNKTASHLMYSVEDNELPRIFINDKLLKEGVFNASVTSGLPEKVKSIRHKGIMEIYSVIGKDSTIQLKRSLFPSDKKPMAIEKFVFTNISKDAVKIEMEYLYRESKPSEERVVRGPHSFVVSSINPGIRTLLPGDSAIFGVSYQAVHKTSEIVKADVQEEEMARRRRVSDILSLMQLETPENVLNTAFDFAKVRGTESIYLTKGGYMHGPGGLRYYAAIWANDQAEYINPFFAFLGDETGNKSAMNSYRWFAKFMNPEYKPIPSSIVAEGDGIWHGAKDRGDMAMIAYGASRYALSYGKADSAKVLWPLIEWCLEYLQKKVNKNGVVESDSDELEGRFPAGNANLHTSALYYDALISSSMLGRQLGKPESQTNKYQEQAKAIRTSIEKFFGAKVEGYDTYRYYEGNDVLRAWICSPLTVDIFDRKEGTIAALFSPRLWTVDGLASEAGKDTFWDRSTLYALRGVLAAGETEKAMDFLKYYSRRRLLGDHVPYPVEAYPEGNQRHLSAESGLYCRIFTEGLFGIRPVAFDGFSCTPRLPKEWNKMALRNIHSFGKVFDMEVSRAKMGKLEIKIKTKGNGKKYLIKEGASQHIQLN